MANIRITDKQTVTPTGSDFMLINQAGSDKNTTLARLKTYMNGSTTLETVAQDTNSAINEVNAKATDASTGINGIKNTIGSGNLETTSQNIIGAVNEVNTKVGNEKLETVAENATGAINELNKKIGNVDIENDGDIATQLNAKANKTDIVENLTTTEEGKILGAKQGNILNANINKRAEILNQIDEDEGRVLEVGGTTYLDLTGCGLACLSIRGTETELLVTYAINTINQYAYNTKELNKMTFGENAENISLSISGYILTVVNNSSIPLTLKYNKISLFKEFKWQ